MPTYAYYISPQKTHLTSASNLWQQPLPLARPETGRTSDFAVSHGEYFEAVRSFFEQNRCQTFTRVLTQRLQRTVLPGDIGLIRIHLEKHGEFYHPARVETDLFGQTFSFVLNVAVTGTGKKHISAEFQNLKRLNDEFSEAYLPRVYSAGEAVSRSGITFSMFLGEWFEDYHEFHITRQNSDGRGNICVWDDKMGRTILSREQTLQLYRQAARIMTCYYNIATFEHIAKWHHAAGDFIIRLDQKSIDLKLITVRGYAPLFRGVSSRETGERDAEQMLQALLIFLLKLSLRMRLDRIDGVGELVWSDPGVVRSTVEGLFEGLAQKPADPVLPDAVATCFQYYLSVCNEQDLIELSDSILQTIQPNSEEFYMIKQNLSEHVGLLVESIREI